MPRQTKPIKKADVHFWSGRLKTGAATGELYIFIRFRTCVPLIESGAATGELYIYIYIYIWFRVHFGDPPDFLHN